VPARKSLRLEKKGSGYKEKPHRGELGREKSKPELKKKKMREGLT